MANVAADVPVPQQQPVQEQKPVETQYYKEKYGESDFVLMFWNPSQPLEQWMVKDLLEGIDVKARGIRVGKTGKCYADFENAETMERVKKLDGQKVGEIVITVSIVPPRVDNSGSYQKRDGDRRDGDRDVRRGGRGGRGGYRGGDRDGGYRSGDRDGGYRSGDRDGGYRSGDRSGDRRSNYHSDRDGGERGGYQRRGYKPFSNDRSGRDDGFRRDTKPENKMDAKPEAADAKAEDKGVQSKYTPDSNQAPQSSGLIAEAFGNRDERRGDRSYGDRSYGDRNGDRNGYGSRRGGRGGYGRRDDQGSRGYGHEDRSSGYGHDDRSSGYDSKFHGKRSGFESTGDDLNWEDVRKVSPSHNKAAPAAAAAPKKEEKKEDEGWETVGFDGKAKKTGK